MYFIVNSDLHMKHGKTTSQVAHVAQIITEEIIRAGYDVSPLPNFYIRYMKWKQNPTKIILKAPESELNKLLSKYTESRYMIDDPNILTAIGFYPCDKISEFAKYKLL